MAQLSQVYQRRWRENYLIIKRKLSRHHFIEYKTDSPPINSLTIVDVLKHLQRTQSNMSKRDLNSDRWSGKRARWPLDHSTTHFDYLFMVFNSTFVTVTMRIFSTCLTGNHNTSGARYSGVPQKVLVVLPHRMSSLQRPKSAIFMWPSLSSSKFSS